jgi:hypothetical protein
MLELPARRASCRSDVSRSLDALLGEPVRLYVATRADGIVDVVDERGELVARWEVGGGVAGIAEAMLRDATGHPPKPRTVEAFVEEVVGVMPADGFAISSSEVCAWLLIRAIERTNT